jgi:Lrp/AsnC family transcriptional regulator for asnA, asnC and gidA
LKKEALDEIDKNILRILQEDARKSYREIQDQLGISIGTIHNRITKLKNNGIIEGYTLRLNNQKLGYKLTFIVNIVIDGKATEEILNEICKKPEVCIVFHITGEQSAILICRFKESEDVHKFIRELNERKMIVRTKSHMVLKEYKNTSYVEI